MSTVHFSSCLAERMRQFVNFKRIEGYDYICRARQLAYFDRFLYRECLSQPRLTPELLQLYVAHTEPLARDTRFNRLSITRVFSRFLHAVDPHSAVLEYIPVKRSSLRRFYLYSQAELNALLNASLQLRPTASLRPHCFHMLIGLIAVTGLRIGEALSLDLRDLDLQHGRLFVRRGKFAKERYVAVHSSTLERLAAYLQIRRRYGADTPASPLFLDRESSRLCYDTARGTFATLRRRTQVGSTAANPPRLHDLRHTYACNCLKKWRREGADVNAKLFQTLETDEVKAVLHLPDPNTLDGARDAVLLGMLYNTGARAQELVDLDLTDIRLDNLRQATLTGKGAKQRVVPIWEETAGAISHYLQLRRQAGIDSNALLLNARGQRITRFGLNYLVARNVSRAAQRCPTLDDKHVTPHTFRHTVALHLIQAGEDIVTVKELLGHADIKTTSKYVEIDLNMKRNAIERCSIRTQQPGQHTQQTPPKWRTPNLLEFLKKLSNAPALC